MPEGFNIYYNAKSGVSRYLTQVNANSAQHAIEIFTRYFETEAPEYIVEGFAKICEENINLSNIFAKRDLEEREIQLFQKSKLLNQ